MRADIKIDRPSASQRATRKYIHKRNRGILLVCSTILAIVAIWNTYHPKKSSTSEFTGQGNGRPHYTDEDSLMASFEGDPSPFGWLIAGKWWPFQEKYTKGDNRKENFQQDIAKDKSTAAIKQENNDHFIRTERNHECPFSEINSGRSRGDSSFIGSSEADLQRLEDNFCRVAKDIPNISLTDNYTVGFEGNQNEKKISSDILKELYMHRNPAKLNKNGIQELEENVNRRQGLNEERQREKKLKTPSGKSRDSQKTILVTGGAGFVGSHLVDRLILHGHRVIVVDNLSTGRFNNVAHWKGHKNFHFLKWDLTRPLQNLPRMNNVQQRELNNEMDIEGDCLNIPIDQVYHLACPASPPQYQDQPVQTLKTGILGTFHALDFAVSKNATFVLASSSEIYGDPLEHPQIESYWGHVNPVGPRACYDEGKRLAEAAAIAYQTQYGLDVRIARIFNTFGPRMGTCDGRLVSNLMKQALLGCSGQSGRVSDIQDYQNPDFSANLYNSMSDTSSGLSIYGDGSQTRSLMYIHDLVDGLMALMAIPQPNIPTSPSTEAQRQSPLHSEKLDTKITSPMIVNLGSDLELSVLHIAKLIILTQQHLFLSLKRPPALLNISYLPAVLDDPKRRRPVILQARERLNWTPRIPLALGILETMAYFENSLCSSPPIDAEYKNFENSFGQSFVHDTLITRHDL